MIENKNGKFQNFKSFNIKPNLYDNEFTELIGFCRFIVLKPKDIG